jgi:Tol biopolymer transport system component
MKNLLFLTLIVLATSCSFITKSDGGSPIQYIAVWGEQIDSIRSYSLHLLNDDGKIEKTALENVTFAIMDVQWLNNSKKIIFSSWEGPSYWAENVQHSLKLHNIKTSETKTLWQSNNNDIHVSEVSVSENDKIAFVAGIYQGVRKICVINPDGTGFKELLEIDARDLKYIDDTIYFLADIEDSLDDNYQVCRINEDGTGFRQILNTKGKGIFEFDISPGEQTIIYDLAIKELDEEVILYQCDIDGKNQTPIMNIDSLPHIHIANLYFNHQTFSPDGDEILFGHNGAIMTIMDGETHSYRQIDFGVRCNLYTPTWYDNGKKIVFSTNENSQTNICIINSDGSDYKVLYSNDFNSSDCFSVSPIYE